jgi:DNA-binding CsgD family transcriptional regulator
MDAKSKAIGFDNFTEFSKDLEQMRRAGGDFMGAHLLRLVGNAFGYDTLSLSRYRRTRFCGVEATGLLAAGDARERYNNFQKKDPFAAHINRTCETAPATLTLQSSAVFSNRYFENEHYRFLYRYGLSWALSMPIGDYRLTLYKSTDEADFNEDERVALQLLSTLLRNCYTAKAAVDAHADAERIQSNVLDSVGVGLICVDRDMEIHSCNRVASSFLNQAYNTNHVQAGFDRLFQDLQQNGTRLRGIHSGLRIDMMGYALIMETVQRGDDLKGMYALSIYPSDTAGGYIPPHKLSERYNLTEREIEVCRLLVSGLSYRKTADALFISLNTVRSHVKNVYKKTGINNLRMLGQLVR